MKKRITSLLLCLIMVTSMVVMPAQAAYTPQHTAQAETLYDLGLFRGTGTNPDGTPIFALDKTATRMQGLIMLISTTASEFTISYRKEGGRYIFDLQDILLEIPNAYKVTSSVMETNDADKKFEAADFSLRSIYLSVPDVTRYCSGLSDTFTPFPDKMTRTERLELGERTYSIIKVIDKDCRLLAYSLVEPGKKNDGKLTFTRCDYSNPEEVEALKAANIEAYQNAVKVDATAFTQSNNVLKADMSKLPDSVKDFKYFVRGHKSGNAVTEEQMVRSALISVQTDILKDTVYAPFIEYGNATNGGNPLKSGSVLLFYNANKVCVGYSLIP